jgi:hypothetical protein
MAQIPKLIRTPKARNRLSLYAQGGEVQPLTEKDLVEFALNMSDATIEMDGTDTVRPSEPIRTVLQYVGSDGTAINTKLLPISKVGNLGSVISPSPLSAADVGSDVTVTIAAFTPQFDFGTLSVGGATITGLSFETFYYIYLTGFSYTDGSYTSALATTSAATMVSSPTNFYIGSITTPADGGGGTSGGGGGGYVEPGTDIEP